MPFKTLEAKNLWLGSESSKSPKKFELYPLDKKQKGKIKSNLRLTPIPNLVAHSTTQKKRIGRVKSLPICKDRGSRWCIISMECGLMQTLRVPPSSRSTMACSPLKGAHTLAKGLTSSTMADLPSTSSLELRKSGDGSQRRRRRVPTGGERK